MNHSPNQLPADPKTSRPAVPHGHSAHLDVSEDRRKQQPNLSPVFITLAFSNFPDEVFDGLKLAGPLFNLISGSLTLFDEEDMV